MRKCFLKMYTRRDNGLVFSFLSVSDLVSIGQWLPLSELLLGTPRLSGNSDLFLL